MRRLIILLFVLLRLPLFAQYPASPNAFDENNRPHGYWTLFYDSNFHVIRSADSVKFYRLIRFDHGKPTGKVRDFTRNYTRQWDGYLTSVDPDVKDGEANYYYENGRLQYHSFYVNDKLEGPFQEYAISGALTGEGNMKHDSSDGKWIFYFPSGAVSYEVFRKRSVDDGLYKSFFENGTVQEQGQKKAGKQTGAWNTYYENGVRGVLQEYEDNVKNGIYRHWNVNGIIDGEGEYIQGKRTGQWTYYDDDGIKESAGAYIDDVKAGNWTVFHPNGKIKYEGRWEKGKQAGPYVYYHDNGVVSAKGVLKDNLFDGRWSFYYSNGNLRREGEYLRDSLNGYCVHYFENGKRKSEGEYVMEVKTGLWKYYDEQTGTLSNSEVLRNGIYDGADIFYFPDGTIKRSGVYKNDTLEQRFTEFYENHQLKTEGEYLHGKRVGVWNWYFSNGRLDSRFSYVDGKYNGHWINYFSNGKIRSEGNAKNGKDEGRQWIYYANGKLKKTGIAVNGKYEGKWTDYDSTSGKKSAVGKFKNNELDGKWVFYDSVGKKKDISYYKNGFWETYGNVRDSIDKLIALGEYDLAIKEVDWLKKIIRRDFDKRDSRTARPLRIYADIAYEREDYQQSLLWYQKYTTAVLQDDGDTSKSFRIGLNGIALCEMNLNHLDKSIELYDSVLHHTASADTGNMVVTLSNKSVALAKAGHGDEGFNLLESKWNELRKIEGDTGKWALEMLDNMAYFQAVSADNCDKGIVLYQQYAALFTKMNRRMDVRFLNAMRHIARCYRSKQKTLESIAAFTEAVMAGDSLGIANTVVWMEDASDLSHLLTDAGRYDSASLLLTRIVETLDKSSRQQTVVYARALDGLATIDYRLDNNEQAISKWKRAAGILEEINQTKGIYYSGILQGIGLAIEASATNRGAESLLWLEKAVEVTRVNQGEDHLQYQKLLSSLGNAYRKHQQFVRADSTLKKAARLMKETIGTDTDDYAECLHESGLLRYNQGDYQGAIDFFDQALTFWRAHKAYSTDTYVNLLLDEARSMRFSDRYNDGEKILHEATDELESTHREKTDLYLIVLSELAYFKNDQQLYSEAEKIFLSILSKQAALTGEKSIQYGYRLYALGRYYISTNELKKAEKYLLAYQAIAFLPAYENSFEPLEVTGRLALVYDYDGQVDKADALYKRSLTLCAHAYGIPSAEYARRTSNYAKFCDAQGRRADAAHYFSIASKIALEIYGKQNTVYGAYLLDEGDLDLRMGKYAEAEKLLSTAHDIANANREDKAEDYRTSLMLLSDFYSEMGRNQEAASIRYDLLKEIEKNEGKHLLYAQEQIELANIQADDEKRQEAVVLINEALSILQEELAPGDEMIARARNALGLIALDEGRLDEAEAQFRFCIDADVLNKRTQYRSYFTRLHNLAAVKAEKGEFAEAQKLYDQVAAGRKSLKITDRLDIEANLQDNVAELYQAWGKYDLAEKNWKEVLEKLQRYINENFPFLSDYEKTKFWKKNGKDFENFTTFAVLDQKRNPAIAGTLYDVQLATKGILLAASNKIRKRIFASRDSVQINNYYLWLQTRELLAKEYTFASSAQKSRRADSLERKVNTLEKELSLVAEDALADKPVTWKDIQKSLSPEEAAVEIIRFRWFDRHRTDSILYAAVVVTAETKNHPLITILPSGEALEKRWYRYYRNSIINLQDDTLSYGKFWSFVEPLVRGKKKIFFSADGVYNQVNLKTLKTRAGKFLMDDHDIVLVSSTRYVIAIKGRKKPRSLLTATLIGNPRFFIGHPRDGKTDSERGYADEDRSGIAELPGTSREISEVESLLEHKGWKVTELVEGKASEENVKQLPASRIVHLATHGFFRDSGGDSWSTNDPMLRAGLLLSGASNFIQNKEESNGENGILTAYEASNLSLEGTEMVVLSACETARGEIHPGEGVYGLQRAFIAAGAESLVMSLWKVDDTATQKLMSLFYANLLNGIDKNQALTLAQQSLKKEYPHPYYWGAFVITD